jgi:hypothetical protein
MKTSWSIPLGTQYQDALGGKYPKKGKYSYQPLKKNKENSCDKFT